MPGRPKVKVNDRELTISNPGKVFFPSNGFTKGDVITYYSDIAEVILPHLRDRPLTLKRYPDGVRGEYFYEKNAPSHTPKWVKTFSVPRSGDGSPIHYVLCNDKATLIWVTNLADIEKHVLLGKVPDLSRPTSVVFDLEGILDCGEIAIRLKGLFDSLGLQSFVKVSGSKGLHLSVPLNSELSFDITHPFAKAVAELMARQIPERVVSEMAKSRRRGKVFIDWSQNSEFKTTVCVYAMRAKHDEPRISMPVTWQELARAVKRADDKLLYFTPAAALKRVKRIGDLFEPVLTLKQALPHAFMEALAAGSPATPTRRPRKHTASRDKSLREYASKRDSARTPEPIADTAPRSTKSEGSHRFVVQKHKASRLHYDFRLEMEGVLRSWAVPKGPPRQLGETRLAMHVEDHPLEYEDFEGTIPAGNYGAGTVMVWDRGEYRELTGDPMAAFLAGKLHLFLEGTKLKGEWTLVKQRGDEEDKWLLIKTGESIRPFSKKVDDRSAKTGRSMSQIAKASDAQWLSNRP
jgi:bifunctional non-homologous end joining protein LigD